VTEFQTQDGTTDSSPTATASSDSSSATYSTDLPTITEIAAFTVPNGGIYTATAIGGTAQIAGRVLTVGGPDALVGGVRVSAAEDGFKFGDRTAAYKSLTGSSTAEAVSSTTGAASSSATASAAESSATESASATESGAEEASSTGGTESASASASESSSATGGAAGGATAMSKAAFTALGCLAVLLCVFA